MALLEYLIQPSQLQPMKQKVLLLEVLILFEDIKTQIIYFQGHINSFLILNLDLIYPQFIKLYCFMIEEIHTTQTTIHSLICMMEKALVYDFSHLLALYD